jgi:hypothetical protein
MWSVREENCICTPSYSLPTCKWCHTCRGTGDTFLFKGFPIAVKLGVLWKWEYSEILQILQIKNDSHIDSVSAPLESGVSTYDDHLSVCADWGSCRKSASTEWSRHVRRHCSFRTSKLWVLGGLCFVSNLLPNYTWHCVLLFLMELVYVVVFLQGWTVLEDWVVQS